MFRTLALPLCPPATSSCPPIPAASVRSTPGRQAGLILIEGAEGAAPQAQNLNVDSWCANRQGNGGRPSPAHTGAATVSADRVFEQLRHPFANQFEDLSPQSTHRLFRRCRRTLP